MRLFYAPYVKLQNFLDEVESKHAIKVLRIKSNEIIHLIDGKGGLYEAKVLDDNSQKCTFEILSVTHSKKKNYFFELVIAPTKNMDRMEWLVEKAVEIGVDSIKFISTQNSERVKLKIERLEKIAVSAMKQSKNFYMPHISELLKFNDVVEDVFEGLKCIAHCEEDKKIHLKDVVNTSVNNIQILIGPEGDFTKDEIQKAVSSKYIPVSLGESRLRTETAGLYACVAINALLN